MKFFIRSVRSRYVLVSLLCLTGWAVAGNPGTPNPKRQVMGMASPSVQHIKVPLESAGLPDRGVFTGKFGAKNEEDGSSYRLQVDIEEGKLILVFYGGGTAGYLYRETTLEEKTKDSEYLVSTEDVEGNGALMFLFKCRAEGMATEVTVSWLDDSEQKPVKLKRE